MTKTFFEKIKLYFFSFVLYCIIGWIYEVALEFGCGNGFVNRGFLNGPYLPVYGFGALLILFTIYNFSKKKIRIGKILITPVIVFILIFFLTSLVEFITGTLLDMFLQKRLWDYTGEFLNINGLVCLKASLRFAFGGTIFLYLLQPFFEKIIEKIPQKTQSILCICLFVLLIVDFALTLISLINI